MGQLESHDSKALIHRLKERLSLAEDKLALHRRQNRDLLAKINAKKIDESSASFQSQLQRMSSISPGPVIAADGLSFLDEILPKQADSETSSALMGMLSEKISMLEQELSNVREELNNVEEERDVLKRRLQQLLVLAETANGADEEAKSLRGTLIQMEKDRAFLIDEVSQLRLQLMDASKNGRIGNPEGPPTPGTPQSPIGRQVKPASNLKTQKQIAPKKSSAKTPTSLPSKPATPAPLPEVGRPLSKLREFDSAISSADLAARVSMMVASHDPSLMESENEDLRNQITRLKELLSERDKICTGSNFELGIATKQLSSMREKLAKDGMENERLQADSVRFQERVKGLELDVVERTAEIFTLQTTMTEMNQSFENIRKRAEEEVLKLQQKLDCCQLELQAAKDEHLDCLEKLRKTETESCKKEIELRKAKERAEGAEADLCGTRAALESALLQMEEQSRSIEGMKIPGECCDAECQTIQDVNDAETETQFQSVAVGIQTEHVNLVSSLVKSIDPPPMESRNRGVQVTFSAIQKEDNTVQEYLMVKLAAAEEEIKRLQSRVEIWRSRFQTLKDGYESLWTR